MNNLSLLVIIAVLPIIFICLYIYNKDKEKEPLKFLIKLFLLGILSCFLVMLISWKIQTVFPIFAKEVDEMSFFEVFLYSFVGVALIEEICKWIMVYFGGYKSKYFDQVYDSVVYAVFVSLGFAFFENLLYVIPKGSFQIGLFRGLLAIPGHACDAIFMGYYLSLAKIAGSKGQKKLELKYQCLSILMPTILHGFYDFCLFANFSILIFIFFIFIICLYKVSFSKLKELSVNNVAVKDIKKECDNCHIYFEGSYCPKCGKRID